MGARSVKRDLRLAEWARIIQRRIESGETINKWCDKNGIPRRKFFYWQRQIREEAAKRIPANYHADVITPVWGAAHSLPTNPEDAAGFARVNIQNPFATPAISVRIGMAECGIYNGADASVIDSVIMALGKTC